VRGLLAAVSDAADQAVGTAVCEKIRAIQAGIGPAASLEEAMPLYSEFRRLMWSQGRG